MTSNAAVANAEKRKNELRETFHRIYCTLSSWMDILYQLHARVYGHHLRASEFCSSARTAIRPFCSPMQDSEVHEISRRDTGAMATQSRAPMECAAISIGSYPMAVAVPQKRDLGPLRDTADSTKEPSRTSLPEDDPPDHEQGPHSPKRGNVNHTADLRSTACMSRVAHTCFQGLCPSARPWRRMAAVVAALLQAIHHKPGGGSLWYGDQPPG